MKKKIEFIKNKKLILALVVLLLIASLPLHIKIVESTPVLDENGVLFIEFQDFNLRVRENSDGRSVYTDINDMNKWKINAWSEYDDEPKITKIYVGYLMYFTDMSGEKIRHYNSNL
ncbi:MAG: hypothetical protein ACRC76_01450, partial [Proteocatella sp.]